VTFPGDIVSFASEILWSNVLVFLRVAPVVSLFPGFGESTVPVRIKLAVALAFTVIMTPAIIPHLSDFGSAAPPFSLVLSETGIGILMGIGIRLFVLALQTTGSIAGQATSLAQILGSAGVTPLPAIGHLLVLGGLALAMMTGLHVQAARMIVLSYDLFPVGHLPRSSDVASWGIRQVGGAFALAFTLAAPFLIVSVLYNLTLGIINRAMPQMMVVFVGAPVITAVGIVLMLLMAPSILTIWITALQTFVVNPSGGVR
jgi:flagellar biosynthetic protein FliR